MIDETKVLIRILHEGQYDWSDEPYWKHPVAVMEMLPKNSSEDRQIIALMHDVLEDCLPKIAEILDRPVDQVSTSVGAQFLLDQGYDPYVIKGVGLLTRDKTNVSYLQEINNIVGSGHIDAMWVKLCDNMQNTNQERIDSLSAANKIRAAEMSKRYEKSKTILRAGILALHPKTFVYKNHRGEIAIRTVNPISLRYGSTEWYPDNQWLLMGIDVERNVEREFAINNVDYVY